MVFKKQSVRIHCPKKKWSEADWVFLPGMEIASTKLPTFVSLRQSPYIRSHTGNFLNVDFIWILGNETFLIILVVVVAVAATGGRGSASFCRLFVLLTPGFNCRWITNNVSVVIYLRLRAT